MSKIVFFDIETSPNEVLSWRIGYNVNLTIDNIIKERQVICACWKYAGDSKVYSVDWGKRRNDRAVVKKLIKVLNEADVAIGHNGDRFDLPWLKGRAMMLGLDPLTNVSTLDTYRMSRRNFNLNSHKLEYLAQVATGSGKLDTGFGLWKKVINGDEKALQKMIDYCKKDVVLLEKVFDHITPYVDNMPKHMGVVKGFSRDSCPKCGNSERQKYGKYYTTGNVFQKYKCGNGHVYRSRTCMKRGE